MAVSGVVDGVVAATAIVASLAVDVQVVETCNGYGALLRVPRL